MKNNSYNFTYYLKNIRRYFLYLSSFGFNPSWKEEIILTNYLYLDKYMNIFISKKHKWIK